MDTDRIICKYFKLHEYEEILCNYKWQIFRCIYCGSYKIYHKDYNISSRYKNFNKLPNKVKEELEMRSIN